MEIIHHGKNEILIDFIKDGLYFYKRYGQISDGSVIRKMFFTDDIDLVITLGNNIYIIQINYSKRIINNQTIQQFFNSCLQIRNYLINYPLNFHYIILTRSKIQDNFLNNEIIKNLYIHYDDLAKGFNLDNVYFEILLLKLHQYISYTSGIITSIKCYQNDDIIMEYYPK